jgi:hypothetical protein
MRHVLVTTKYKGVYQGVLKNHDIDREQCVLLDANMAIRWGTTDGVDQLANTGPTDNSKIAAMAPEVWLCGLTSIADCTEVAIEKWRQYKK